jgi:hypothetical protein
MFHFGAPSVGVDDLPGSRSAENLAPCVAAAPSRRAAVLIWHCVSFSLLFAIGAGGLSSQSAGRLSLIHVAEWHEFFATSIVLLVLMRGLWGCRALQGNTRDDWRNFNRHTARGVYLLLYALIGVQLIFDLSSSRQLHMEHCQFYVIIGVFSLLLSRGLSAVMLRCGATSSEVTTNRRR